MARRFAEILGERIKKRRKINGLSQAELGKLVKVGNRQILGYEKASVGITIEQVEEIARALGVPIINLLFPGEVPEPVKLNPTPLEALKIVEQALKEKSQGPLDILASRVISALTPLNEDQAEGLVGMLEGTAETLAAEARDDEKKPG